MMAFGPGGDIQIGCGITAMDMEVLTPGGTAIIIIGPGHSLFMEECMTLSTLFGDIMTRSFMATDMVTDIHMVIIRGGGHITIGTITTLLEETLVQTFHL